METERALGEEGEILVKFYVDGKWSQGRGGKLNEWFIMVF